jgi:hypothetical protein
VIAPSSSRGRNGVHSSPPLKRGSIGRPAFVLKIDATVATGDFDQDLTCGAVRNVTVAAATMKTPFNGVPAE